MICRLAVYSLSTAAGAVLLYLGAALLTPDPQAPPSPPLTTRGATP